MTDSKDITELVKQAERKNPKWEMGLFLGQFLYSDLCFFNNNPCPPSISAATLEIINDGRVEWTAVFTGGTHYVWDHIMIWNHGKHFVFGEIHARKYFSMHREDTITFSCSFEGSGFATPNQLLTIDANGYVSAPTTP